jgi:hypothetical protein
MPLIGSPKTIFSKLTTAKGAAAAATRILLRRFLFWGEQNPRSHEGRTADGAAVRRYVELLLVVFAASRGVQTIHSVTLAAALATMAAAFGIFARLQVVHINFFLLFAHICLSLGWGCVSRAESFSVFLVFGELTADARSPFVPRNCARHVLGRVGF